jgi:hypothetical protein
MLTYMPSLPDADADTEMVNGPSGPARTPARTFANGEYPRVRLVDVEGVGGRHRGEQLARALGARAEVVAGLEIAAGPRTRVAAHLRRQRVERTCSPLLDPATLSRWQAAPRLVPVALVEDVTVARDVHLTVLLPSGLRVEHIPLADLRRVIEALA